MTVIRQRIEAVRLVSLKHFALYLSHKKLFLEADRTLDSYPIQNMVFILPFIILLTNIMIQDQLEFKKRPLFEFCFLTDNTLPTNFLVLPESSKVDELLKTIKFFTLRKEETLPNNAAYGILHFPINNKGITSLSWLQDDKTLNECNLNLNVFTFHSLHSLVVTVITGHSRIQVKASDR
jgi:hypothetical protein